MSKAVRFLGVPLLALTWVLVLALGAFAGDGVVNTSVSNVRINLDRTVVEKGKAVNVVVELLDDQGRVAQFAENNVQNIYVSVASSIGDIEDLPGGVCNNGTGDDVGTFQADSCKVPVSNGKAGFHITYNNVGTDTLQFYVVIQDLDGDVLTLGPYEKTVTVTTPNNQAKSLLLVSVEPTTSTPDASGAVYADSTTNSTGNYATIDAGEPFVMKVFALACDSGDCDTDNKTTAQNGEVRVWFVLTGDDDCTYTKTVTGTMENGVAYIDVPAGTLTKSGNYTIYMEADTTATSDGKAREIVAQKLVVDPAGPDHVVVSVDKSYLLDEGVNATVGAPTLPFTLVDQYGNPADTDEVASPVEIDLSSNYDVLDGAKTATVTIAANTNVQTFPSFKWGTDKPTNFTDGQAAITVSFSSPDYTVEPSSLEFTVYQKGLAVKARDLDYTAGQSQDAAILVGLVDAANSTVIALSSNDTSVANATIDVASFTTNATWWCETGWVLKVEDADTTATAVDNATLTLYCGTISLNSTTVNATANNADPYVWSFSGITIEVSNATLAAAASGTANSTVTFTSQLQGKSVEVTLVDNGTDVETVTSRVVGIGVVTLRYSKALAGDGGESYRVAYASSGTQYAPGESGSVTVNVASAEPAVVKVYKAGTAVEGCAGRASASQEVSGTIEVSQGDTLVFFNNATSATDYYVRLEDMYGNPVANETVYVSTDGVSPEPTLNPSSGEVSYGGNLTATFNEVGNETLEFSVAEPGVNPATVAVSVVAPATLDRVEIIPASEYVLTNGEIPVIVRAYKSDGSAYSGSLDLVLSSSLASVCPGATRTNSTTCYSNGDTININGEMVLSLQAGNTPGDFTITLRNASGSVQGSATVHIVSSINDIPAPVASVSFSPASLTVQPEANATVTLVVADANGNGLSGKTCTVETDAESGPA